MSISGYRVIEQVKTPAGVFPLVDIPMMSDERWQQLALESMKRSGRDSGRKGGTGDAISPEAYKAYEEQADRAAKLLLCAVGA